MAVGKTLANELGMAQKSYGGAVHLFRVSYELSLDARLLLRSLDKIDFSVRTVIGLILKKAHIGKKIIISKDKSENLKLFFDRFSELTGLENKSAGKIKDILRIAEIHRKSGFDFSFDGKAIMLMDEGKVEELSKEQVEEFILVCKELLLSVGRNFLGKIRKI